MLSRLRSDEAGMISGDGILIAAIALLATLATASALQSNDAITMSQATPHAPQASNVVPNATLQNNFLNPQQQPQTPRKTPQQRFEQHPQPIAPTVAPTVAPTIAPTHFQPPRYVPRSRFPMRGIPIHIQYVGQPSPTYSRSPAGRSGFVSQHSVRPTQTGISVNYHTGVPRMRVSEWRPRSTGMTMTEARRAGFSD